MILYFEQFSLLTSLDIRLLSPFIFADASLTSASLLLSGVVMIADNYRDILFVYLS